MRISKILMTIMVLMVFTLFSGCSLGGGDAQRAGFFGGDSSSQTSGSGIDLTFAEGNPPSELFKDQPTQFAFIFKNNQKHDITDLVLKTSGFDRNFVSGLSQTYNIQNIPKATDAAGAGIFSGLVERNVKIGGFVGDYNFNSKFDYCYTAKTQFRQQVCVPSEENICELSANQAVEQNGPLRVNVENINSYQDKIRVGFAVSDSLYRKGTSQVVNDCFKTDDYSNSYELTEIKLGTDIGDCTAISGYSVQNGRANFYCDFQRSGGGSYLSQITIELEYKYQQSTSKKIIVRDLERAFGE